MTPDAREQIKADSERDAAKDYDRRRSKSRCVICKRPAICDYPLDALDEFTCANSCGRIACELQIQSAMDYHDEHVNGS